MVIALPLLLLSLGLFTVVINSLLLYWVGALVKGFHVADFWSALKGSILISVVSIAGNALLGPREPKVRPPGPPPASRPKGPADTGSGPVIDV